MDSPDDRVLGHKLTDDDDTTAEVRIAENTVGREFTLGNLQSEKSCAHADTMPALEGGIIFDVIAQHTVRLPLAESN